MPATRRGTQVVDACDGQPTDLPACLHNARIPRWLKMQPTSIFTQPFIGHQRHFAHDLIHDTPDGVHVARQRGRKRCGWCSTCHNQLWCKVHQFCSMFE
jgi:hypothetical protein